MAKLRVLFITNYPNKSAPGQRFRFEQYFTFLQENEIEVVVSPILTLKEARLLYNQGHLLEKFWILLKGFFLRIYDVLRSPSYDAVFIFREAYLAGPPLFEWLFRRMSKKIIFDFDDAIWLQDVSEANKHFGWLKFPGKTRYSLKLTDLVLAGNRYLANYARAFAPNVFIMPTTLVTDLHKPGLKKNATSRICIGWTGSVTTIKHFEFGIPFLTQLKLKYGEKIYFKVIGDANYSNTELGIKGTPWNIETEVEDLREIDIGIMPLPNDEWAQGKCGFKALQYMSLEIPAVISPVGVNTEIIQDGKNGYLADKNSEWIEKLSKLIESEDLRIALGCEGRKTVVQKYSYEAWKSRYVELFKTL